VYIFCLPAYNTQKNCVRLVTQITLTEIDGFLAGNWRVQRLRVKLFVGDFISAIVVIVIIKGGVRCRSSSVGAVRCHVGVFNEQHGARR